MDLMTAANDLKDLSDQQLQKELLQPSGQFPSFLALSEVQRRKDMRNDFSARQQAGPQPSMAQQYAQGLGQANTPYASAVRQGEGAPTQPPQGMMTNAQMNSGPMDTPLGQQPQGFADGGPVPQWTPPAGQAPPQFLTRLFDNGGAYSTQQTGTAPVLPTVGAAKMAGVGPGVATSPLAQQAGAPQLASPAQQQGLGQLMQNPSALQGYADGGEVGGGDSYTAMPGSMEGRMRALARVPIQTVAPFGSVPQQVDPIISRIGRGNPSYQNPMLQGLPGVNPLGTQSIPQGGPSLMSDIPQGSVTSMPPGMAIHGNASAPAASSPQTIPAGLGGAMGGGLATMLPPAPVSQGYGGGEPDVPPGAAPEAFGPPVPPGLEGAASPGQKQFLQSPPPGPGGGSVSTGGVTAGTASGRGQSLADYYKSIQDIKLPDRYADLAAANQKDRDALEASKGTNAGLALAQAGFAMAAGRSPYALSNIGEGALAGIKFWNDSQKEMQQAQRDLRNADQSIAIAQANRDERGLENAIKIKAHAEDLDSRAKDRASAAGIAASARQQALELKKMELDNDALNRSELREQHRIDGFQSAARVAGSQVDQLQTKLVGLKVDPLADADTRAAQQQEVARTQALLQQRQAEQAQATDLWKKATLDREVRLGNMVVAVPGDDPQSKGMYYDVKSGQQKKMTKGMRFITNDYKVGIYKGD